MGSKTSVQYAGHDSAPGALAGVGEVAGIIAGQVKLGGTCLRPTERCAGYVLNFDLRVDSDLPAFDKSMMDGFAVRARDTSAPPVELRLVGEIAAGAPAMRPVGAGEAMRINTGAPMPEGADAVVMLERVEELNDPPRIRLKAGVRSGQNVMKKGAICSKGEVVTPGRVRLGPAQIGAAATVGTVELDVFEKPKLALLPTGDEIVRGGGTLKPGQIHESNGPSLAALGRELGAEVVDLGICGDDREALRDRLKRGLECPILVVVGGMSMGTHDLAPGVLAELGVQWLVHGVDMRPGRPMGYGVGPNGQHVFGLPGNPVSCFVCFSLFVRIAIDGMSGLDARLPTFWNARLIEDVKSSNDGRPAYLPARLSVDMDGNPQVQSVSWKGSGDPIGLGRANALLHQPAGGAAIPAGQMVKVMTIGAFAL